MKSFVSLAVIGVLATLQANAQDFVGWRTDGSGAYPSATPPTEWSKIKNIVWSTPLSAFSNASPVISGDILFICAEPETLLCVHVADGKILWQQSNTFEDAATPEELEERKKALLESAPLMKEKAAAAKELQQARDIFKKTPDDADAKQKVDEANAKVTDINKKLQPFLSCLPPSAHGTNGYSSSTPATDGKNVYEIFGNGVVCCYSIDGQRVWIRKLENPGNSYGWGHSQSPVLAGQRLFVHLNDLHALNPATGETIWTAKVPSSFGTPAVVKIGDADCILTPAGDLVRTSDGKILAPHVSKLEYNSPFIHDNVAYFIDQYDSKALTLPDKPADMLTLDPVWKIKFDKDQKDRYYASPVFIDGLLYVVNQKGHFSALDAKTGATVFEKPLGLGGTCYPSVALAGKYLFVSSDNGVTAVVEPGKEYKEIARNTLEPFKCSPVFAGKRMYVRGSTALYCIGEP